MYLKTSVIIFPLLLLLFFTGGCNCAKILGIFAFPGKSHSMMYNTLLQELVIKGHEVTVITNFPIERKLENYTEILIEPIYDFWSDVKKTLQVDNLFDLTEITFPQIMTALFTIGFGTTEYALQHKNVQELIQSTDKKFDLILSEQFYNEAFLMFAHKYKAPIVTMGTLNLQILNPIMGGINPWSHVPHEFVTFSDQMTFWERFYNVYVSLYEKIIRAYVYYPHQEKLVQKYFANLPEGGPLPTIADLEKNISVMLVNTHLALQTSRPKITGIINVGGLHIRAPKQLPWDIRQFLDDAHSGAIYFSLGTNLKSSDIPPDKLATFLNVLGSLKQKILWKWEDEKIPNLPKNILIKKWMPQSDILAHPYVRLFITHGGLLSTQEGIFRAVPMLGLPIYCDQHLNMDKASKAGYAITLAFPNVTETSLKWALNQLLENPSYTNKIRQLSQLFRDRPVGALEEAIYWIEYVIRYNGAPHIRSAALDLSWFNYFLLDIICFILALTIISIGIFYILIKYFIMRQNQKRLKKKFI